MVILKQQQDRKRTSEPCQEPDQFTLFFLFLPCNQPEGAGTWKNKEAPGDPRGTPRPAHLTQQEQLAWCEDSVTVDLMDIKPSLGSGTPPFRIVGALVTQPASREGHTPAHHTASPPPPFSLGNTKAPRILNLCMAKCVQNPDLSPGSLQTLAMSRSLRKENAAAYRLLDGL